MIMFSSELTEYLQARSSEMEHGYKFIWHFQRREQIWQKVLKDDKHNNVQWKKFPALGLGPTNI